MWRYYKNNAICDEKSQMQKLRKIVGNFRISLLSRKTAKKMAYAMEDMNKETAYNCKQFPYLILKWKNYKKHAFYNINPDYRNCFQL